MGRRDLLTTSLDVEIYFYLPNHSRRDIDNLSKAILDAMNQVVYIDDCQVVDLLLHKRFNADEYGVTVAVKEATE